MKNILNVFINFVVVFAFGIGYAPLAVLAQDAGTVQPPPPSGGSVLPPPPSGEFMPPPPPSNMLPPPPDGSMTSPMGGSMPLPPTSGGSGGTGSFSVPPTQTGSFEPNHMPPPEGTNRFMPPKEPNHMPPPPGTKGKMQQPPQGEQESKGQKSNGQQFEDENGDFEHEEGDFEEFVDPRELKDALRQLKDLKKQIQRTLKQAQKSANFTSEKEELNSLLSEVSSFSQSLSGAPVSRDTLQEFYDAQIWDKFNAIRIKVEFPQEIKNIEKDLKRVEKLLATRNFSVERIDVGAIRARVEEIKNAVAQARESFNAGNFDDAQEALSVIHEGLHPGEVFGILNQLREIDKRLKSMKGEVKNIFQEALTPVYEAISAGDFREANQMLNDVRNELFKLFSKVKSKSTGVSDDIRKKLQSLEGQLENKHQQLERQNSSSQESQSLNYEQYAPHKASVLETLTGWLNFSK